jgi:DNA-binding transcriptional LysR family regulator
MPQVPFTLHQLQVFVEVARARSFTEAGKRLGMSQPAVSLAVAELERRLDVPLLERSRRSLALTPEGELLWARATGVIEEAEATAEALSRTDRGATGTLRIGASTTLGNYILPVHLCAFQDQHPQVHIQALIDNTRAIVDVIVEQRADVGFVEGPCHAPGVEVEPFLRDELVVICPPRHPWASRAAVPWEEAKQERFILREEGSGTRDVIVQSLDRHGLRLETSLTMGHTEAIKTCVELGRGVTLLSRVACEREIAAGVLGTTRLEGITLDRWMYRISLADRRKGSLVTAILDFLAARLPSVGEPGRLEGEPPGSAGVVS